jgi:hypothetical protein
MEQEMTVAARMHACNSSLRWKATLLRTHRRATATATDSNSSSSSSFNHHHHHHHHHHDVAGRRVLRRVLKRGQTGE